MTTHSVSRTPSTPPSTSTRGWFGPDALRLADFRAVVEQPTDPADYPNADSVEQGVLVYGTRWRERLPAPNGRQDLQSELIRALADGPGVVVFTGAFPDVGVVERATEVFTAIIADQRASGAV